MEKVLSGVLNIYKPLGITSNGVVTRVRRLTGIKKVGHTGTLDPEAEGVLPICIGKATKVAGMLTDADKAYRATIKLGVTTDSQDMTGNILTSHKADVTREQFEEVLSSFVGKVSQIPPMYSAIKMNGQPLYKLARKGVEVERKPRVITISEINLLDFLGDEAVFEVFCSKGTYIRTLCADIGEKLGIGAAMKALVRIKSGPFCAEKSVKLEELEKHPEKIEQLLISPDSLFDYHELMVDTKQMEKIKSGIRIRYEKAENGLKYKVYGPAGEFLCISEGKDGELIMVQSFY